MLAGMELLSVIARLSLAALFGGLLGLERERKNRPAGLRTYLIVCVGAALTVLLSEYEQWMLSTRWADAAGSAVQIDISRLGAQVINGIGFLGAGTILVSSRKKVRGLTTAAGLWASACMGLAVGAGFYTCVWAGFVLIYLAMYLLPRLEERILSRARNMNVYVAYRSPENISIITDSLREQQVQIYDVETCPAEGHDAAPFCCCICLWGSAIFPCWVICPSLPAYRRSTKCRRWYPCWHFWTPFAI